MMIHTHIVGVADHAGESSRVGMVKTKHPGESFFEPRFPFSRCFGIGEAVTLSALSRSVLFCRFIVFLSDRRTTYLLDFKL